MAKKVLSVRVDEGLLGELDALAKERGLKRAEAVESCLREGMRPRVVAESPRGAGRLRPLPPGVKTGAELLRERQARLNKQIGWAEKS